MVEKRKRYTIDFKFRVALEAVKEKKTINQIAGEHEVHPNQVGQWKRQLLEEGSKIFGTGNGRREKESEARRQELYEQIGRQKMELEWLKKSCPIRSMKRGALLNPS